MSLRFGRAAEEEAYLSNEFALLPPADEPVVQARRDIVTQAQWRIERGAGPAERWSNAESDG